MKDGGETGRGGGARARSRAETGDMAVHDPGVRAARGRAGREPASLQHRQGVRTSTVRAPRARLPGWTCLNTQLAA